MRQNSPLYGIVGNGRVARHILTYFNFLQIPYLHWFRDNTQQISPEGVLKKCNPILLLISDDSIVPFIKKHLFLQKKRVIHFSGALVTNLAYSTHPLISFGSSVYDLETYQKIPFICEEGAPFNELFPKLSNPHYSISRELKPYYHALCVMSGNFSVLLWQKLLTTLEYSFAIPHEVAFPYLKSTTDHLIENYKHSLTGPLIRNDYKTINQNLQSLERDPFLEIYKTFVKVFSENRRKDNSSSF